MGSGLSAGRRERRKRQPAALPRRERDDAYGSASTYICAVLFQRANPMHIGISHGVDPRAASPGPDPHHEASPPTRSHPADMAEFQVFAVGSGGRGSAHHPPAAPLAVLRTGLNFKFCRAGTSGRGSVINLLRRPRCPCSAAITHLGSGSRAARRQRLHPGHQKARGGWASSLKTAPVP